MLFFFGVKGVGTEKQFGKVKFELNMCMSL